MLAPTVDGCHLDVCEVLVLGAGREEEGGRARQGKGGMGSTKSPRLRCSMSPVGLWSSSGGLLDGIWPVESGRRARGCSGNKWLLAARAPPLTWSFRRGTVGLRLHRDYVTCSRRLELVPLCPAFSPSPHQAQRQVPGLTAKGVSRLAELNDNLQQRASTTTTTATVATTASLDSIVPTRRDLRPTTETQGHTWLRALHSA